MQNKTYVVLKDVLAAERESLRNGDFDALQGLAIRKEALLDADVKATLSEKELRDVGERLQVNQKLLAAAIDGVQAARERLAALETVRTSLGVYDQHGQMPAPSASRTGLNRKA